MTGDWNPPNDKGGRETIGAGGARIASPLTAPRAARQRFHFLRWTTRKALRSVAATHCFVCWRTEHSTAMGISLEKLQFLPTKEWVASGAIELGFLPLLLKKSGIGDPAFAAQWDESECPGPTETLARSPTDYQRNDHAAQRQEPRR